MMNQKEQDTSFFLPLPPASKNTESLSPYRISIVILIREHLKKQQDSDENSDGSTKYQLPSTGYDAEYRRKFYMTLLKLIQLPDLSYKDLHHTLSSGPHKIKQKHLDGLQSVMADLQKSGVEVLFKLAKTMDELITLHNPNFNGNIHQSSVVGFYFRRIFVHLEKMSFQELMELHKNICSYYEKGVRALAIAPGVVSNRDDIPAKHKWSAKQAEIFVTQQTSLLENDEVNALNPKELQKRIDEIVQIYNPLYSKAYFLSYLNNVRIRDLPNSCEALHRSFDRNAGKYGQNHTENSAAKSNFQYSALNLAILHTVFDHNAEALKSLKECIMIAQENGDRVCLQLAQLWLCLLDKTNFQLSEKNIANKTEMSLVRSVSLNIQSLVKVAAISGYLPAKLFDVLIKSDILNCQYSMVNLVSNCIAERAALWTLYGKNELASLFSQLLLNSNLKTMERPHNGEGTCQALCNVALRLAFHGDFSSSSAILNRAMEKFPRFPFARNWMLINFYISSQQAIYSEKWSNASTACDHLYHLDKNLSLLQRANMNIARGNRHVAITLLDQLLAQDDDVLEPLFRVRGLVMQAQSMIDPETLPAEALLQLNRAAALAKEKHLSYEQSHAEMNIAFVLHRMDMHQQALKMVQRCIENILANGGIYDKAKVHFLFAQCLILSSTSKESKSEKLRRVKEQLETSIEYFTRLECWNKVKDVYMFLAKLHHELGNIDERNHYALKFRLTAEERTNNNNDHVNIFH